MKVGDLMFDGDELELYAWEEYCDKEDEYFEEEGLQYEKVDIEHNAKQLDSHEAGFEECLHDFDDVREKHEGNNPACFVECTDEEIEELFRKANDAR